MRLMAPLYHGEKGSMRLMVPLYHGGYSCMRLMVPLYHGGQVVCASWSLSTMVGGSTRLVVSLP